MLKGTVLQHTIFTFGRINNVDRLADGKKNFDRAREGIGWRDECPRMDWILGWYGQ